MENTEDGDAREKRPALVIQPGVLGKPAGAAGARRWNRTVKLLLKIVLGLFVLSAALVAYAWLGNQPEAFPAGSVSAQRLAPGPWTVARRSQTFVDRRRETPANGEYAGAPERRMPGTVWYPLEAEAGEGPLLLFSHGFTSFRANGRYLGEHLASHGFVVVAVDYPLTSLTAPGGAFVNDVMNQPGDLSFLIDTLTAQSSVAGHALSGKIDARRIGVFGISLGGLTSTLAGYHPELRDRRIDAVLSIAGPTNFFTPTFFTHADAPFLMLAGEYDALVPWSTNAEPVPAKVPGARLVTVARGAHTGFSFGARWLRMLKNPDVVGCYFVTSNIEDDADADDWAGILGPAEIGIDYGVGDELCKVDPLPETLNVLRQQMIARVVTRAFFESTLSRDPSTRSTAARYLDEILASELADVRVTGGEAALSAR